MAALVRAGARRVSAMLNSAPAAGILGQPSKSSIWKPSSVPRLTERALMGTYVGTICRGGLLGRLQTRGISAQRKLAEEFSYLRRREMKNLEAMEFKLPRSKWSEGVPKLADPQPGFWTRHASVVKNRAIIFAGVGILTSCSCFLLISRTEEGDEGGVTEEEIPKKIEAGVGAVDVSKKTDAGHAGAEVSVC